jgi:hypothetical protein
MFSSKKLGKGRAGGRRIGDAAELQDNENSKAPETLPEFHRLADVSR